MIQIVTIQTFNMFDNMYVLDHWTNVALEEIWKEQVKAAIELDMKIYIDELWANMFVRKIC